MQKTPADVLEEAADLLLIHGRCRVDLAKPSGEHCVVGAVGAVAGIDAWAAYEHPAVAAVADSLALESGPYPFSRGLAVGDWNDATEDDFEVIDALRRTAKDLRNEAS